MSEKPVDADKFFIPFSRTVNKYPLPTRFILDNSPHPLALHAAKDLQQYLKTQKDWVHNFGLSSAQEGKVIGKMFGVLVVKTWQNDLGYLAAFSGKLANSNQHTKFVPPVWGAEKPDPAFQECSLQKPAQRCWRMCWSEASSICFSASYDTHYSY